MFVSVWCSLNSLLSNITKQVRVTDKYMYFELRLVLDCR